jgi:hypothetical protein
VSAIPEELDVFSDEEARYSDACDRRRAVIAAWTQLGQPLTASGSMGQPVDHPLIKQMNDLDRLCNLLGQALKRKHAGPDPSAVVRASVGRSPASKLRRVK